MRRPFSSTLSAADNLMPRDKYHGATLSQLAFHTPTFLLTLFEGVVDIWKSDTSVRTGTVGPYPEGFPLKISTTTCASGVLHSTLSRSRNPIRPRPLYLPRSLRNPWKDLSLAMTQPISLNPLLMLQ